MRQQRILFHTAGCRYVVFRFFKNHADAAGCSCWLPDFYLISQSVPKDDDDPEIFSDGNINSCRHANDKPAATHCLAEGGSGSVTEWSMNGELNWKMIKKVLGVAINANVGGTSTKNFAASAKTTIARGVEHVTPRRVFGMKL